MAARVRADDVVPATLPTVGTHMRPNAELIAALKPDVVLQATGRKEASAQTEALRALGVPVLEFDLNSFASLFATTEKLGALVGAPERAKALAGEWRRRLEKVRNRRGSGPPPKVFYEIRHPNLLAAGTNSIINEIIEIAGGENVVQTTKKIVRLNEESLFANPPDVYVYQRGPMNPNPENPARRNVFSELAAVKNDRVLEVDEKKFARPGPRSVDAAEELNLFLFPKNRAPRAPGK